jgi:exopolyphosphatase/guanosine-5'-triphosphate,3'-diphosphate pyrophosphatase
MSPEFGDLARNAAVKSHPFSVKNVASIDIGTNTILLLIAAVDKGRINPLSEMETVVRLGEGVHEHGILSKEAMERGLQTLSQYLEQCQAMKAHEVFAVGTSALREAKNSEVFLRLVKEKLNLSIDVISGEEEAHLSFLAVARDLQESGEPLMVVDIGGGSTEFILGKDDQIRQWISLPLGSVRFTERFLRSDPVQEEEWQKMERNILESLIDIPHSPGPLLMVAVGGTATTLAAVGQGLREFVIEKIHHFILKKGTLRNQLLLYRSKTIEERKKIPGLPLARADVILAGAAILYLTMEELHCPTVLISCHGVRYGLLYRKLNL